ncbi:MAG: hypothetical protein JNG88_06445 [Phycisphaerales bacterium]|nr:hypothetical protein [Phycisphaerales bacterium]
MAWIFRTIIEPSIRVPVARRWSLALMLAIGGVATICGQNAEPQAKPTSQPSLTTRQQAIQERYQRLESRMLQLAQLLAESEPDKAARLRDAMDRAGQQRIKLRIDQLMRMLRTEQLSDAEREQQKLVADLEAMLELLANTGSDIDQRRAERQRLENLKRAVRALLDEQNDEFQRTQQAEPAQKAVAAMERLSEALEQLASRQAQIRSAENSPNAREEQDALARQTADAAAELKKAADTAEQSEARGALQAASELTQRAAEAMRQAGRETEDQAAAAKAQREAEEQLRRAVKRLREEQDRTLESSGLREIERGQRDLQRRTSDLQREMEPSSGKQKSAPGAPNVGRAAERMQQAADRIGEHQPDDAQQEQVGAMSELQNALDELEDSLRQLRKEELEDTLAALAARFRKMLNSELEVREAISPLADKPRADWTRTDEQTVARAAKTQSETTDDAQATLRILTDEGTTIILPDLLRQLGGQMNTLKQRLDQADVGEETRRSLADVIEMLEEIVGAIEARRQEQDQSGRQEGDQNSQSGQGSEPLLKLSAELRLLRGAQTRVNARTRELTAQPDADVDADTRATLERLSARQKELAELARRLYERKE